MVAMPPVSLSPAGLTGMTTVSFSSPPSSASSTDAVGAGVTSAVGTGSVVDVGAGSSFLTSAGAVAAAAGDGDTAASSAVAETGSSEKHSVSARRKLNTRLFMG